MIQSRSPLVCDTIENAIASSRFREKIRKTIERPALGFDSLEYNNNWGWHSNCWGTTVYILGAEKHLLHNFEYYTKGGLIFVEGAGGKSAFRKDLDRPGYVDDEHMEWLFQHFCTFLNAKQRDCIVASYNNGLIHTSIYLGVVQGSGKVVDQAGEGEIFRVANFENPHIYDGEGVKFHKYFRYEDCVVT